jgi:uncharacterized protein
MAKMARSTFRSYRGEFMSNRFLAGLMALAVCFIIALPAYAQSDTTPEKKALIKELLTLMNASNNSEAITNQLMGGLQEPLTGLASNMLREWIQSLEVAPAERKRMEDEVPESSQRIANRIRAEIPKRIKFGELTEKVGLEIYDKLFTEAEVKDLIAFYKTSTAQKFVRLTPQLTAEMFQSIQKSMDPELHQLIIESFAAEQNRFIPKRN